LFAFGVFVRFHDEKWYPITGDEPNYLVTASGIVHDHTLVQTVPYEQEFASDKIYRPYRLALPGTRPTPANAQIVDGPHGQFPFHGLGLSIVLGPGLWLGGVIGAQIEMILLSGVAVGAAAWLAISRIPSPLGACLAAVAVGVGMPLLPAASQIYPDIAGGTMLVVVLVAYMCRVRRRPLLVDVWLALLLAAVPWFNVKFALPGAIAGAALGWQYWKHGERRRLAILFVICAGSLILLAGYNEYAFGHLAGPYNAKDNGAPRLDATATMVIFGIQIDRFQGIFVQQPLLLIGLLYAVRSVVRHQGWAILTLLLYLSLLIPNGLEPQTYVGTSFAGRFSWSAGIILFVPTIMGLARLLERRRVAFIVVISIGLVVQATFLAEYVSHRFDFYNKTPTTWLELYPSLWGPLRRFLPALYDRAWAFTYVPNVLAIIVLVVAVVGAAIGFRKLLMAIGATSVTVGLIACTAVALPAPPQYYLASSLPGQVGRIVGSSREAEAPSDKPGYLTFGPVSLVLPPETDTFDLIYEATGMQSVGTWDIRVSKNPAKPGGIDVRQGVIPSTSGRVQTLREVFRLPPSRTAWDVQFRTVFGGKGALIVHELILHRGT
jgi:hypothetical protein